MIGPIGNLLHAPGGGLALGIWLGALAIATVTDLERRRIPNWLTGSAILGALVLHACYGGLAGLIGSGIACALWMGLGYLFWATISGIGAGDIKLIAASAALAGTMPTLYAAFTSFALQVAWLLVRWTLGGTLGENIKRIGLWLWTLAHPRTAKVHFKPVGTPDKTPHAPFLLVGTLLVLALTRLGVL